MESGVEQIKEIVKKGNDYPAKMQVPKFGGPNAPARPVGQKVTQPPTSFMLFFNEYRQQFRDKYPSKQHYLLKLFIFSS